MSWNKALVDVSSPSLGKYIMPCSIANSLTLLQLKQYIVPLIGMCMNVHATFMCMYEC